VGFISRVSSYFPRVRVPRFRKIFHISPKIAEFTGRRGRVLKPVKSLGILKFGKKLLASLRTAKTHYSRLYEISKEDSLKRLSKLGTAIGNVFSCTSDISAVATKPIEETIVMATNVVLEPYNSVAGSVLDVHQEVKALNDEDVSKTLQAVGRNLQAVQTADLLEAIVVERDRYGVVPIAEAVYISDSVPNLAEEHLVTATPVRTFEASDKNLYDNLYASPSTTNLSFPAPSAPPASTMMGAEVWSQQNGDLPTYESLYENDGGPNPPAFSSEYRTPLFETGSINRIQSKSIVLTTQIDELLRVFTEDLIPSTKRFSSNAEKVSNSYKKVLMKKVPKEQGQNGLRRFNTTLQKESINLELMSSIATDSSLNLKLATAGILPKNLQFLYSDMDRMKEDADLILAKFNSIQTYLEEQGITSQVAGLRKELEAVNDMENGYTNRVMTETFESLDRVSQGLDAISAFSYHFERKEAVFLNDYSRKPHSLIKEILKALQALLINDGIHNSRPSYL
jgi:hypothetical protein